MRAVSTVRAVRVVSVVSVVNVVSAVSDINDAYAGDGSIAMVQTPVLARALNDLLRDYRDRAIHYFDRVVRQLLICVMQGLPLSHWK